MKTNDKLRVFVVLMGGKDRDDLIEAHNLFIGVAERIESLLPNMKRDWPAVTHIDAYMTLGVVDVQKSVAGFAVVLTNFELRNSTNKLSHRHSKHPQDSLILIQKLNFSS